MNQEQIFKFTMNIAMLQIVLEGVGKLPFEKAAGVHAELINQYNNQLKAVEQDLKEKKLAMAKEKEETEQLNT